MKEQKQNVTPTSNSKVDNALENFTKPIVEPPKKKHGWVSILVLFVIIGLGIYFMVQLATSAGEDEVRSLGEIIANLDVKYAIITVAVLIGIILLEGCKFLIVTHATTGLLRPLNSLKVSLIGKYYDGITPFSVGGQPMQIVYLHKKGHSAGVSTAIIMIKYFINMLCCAVMYFLLMLLNRGALSQYVAESQQRFFMIAGWIGWAIFAIMPFSIIIFALFPKFTNKILLFFINLATKFSFSIAKKKEVKTGKSQFGRKKKIIRRKQKWINSAYTAVKDFRSSFIIMSHKPIQFILLVINCLVEEFMIFALPYFILVAFDSTRNPDVNLMFAIMTLNVYAAMSVSVVPTPGNSGALENVNIVIYKSLVETATVVFWMVFTWRFFTYYIYILIGLVITIVDMIRKAVRRKRELK